MNEVISCMGLVLSNNNRVVVLQNREGCWVFPKGHLEENETFVDTAIREVNEESGITLNKNDFLLQIYEYKYYTIKENATKTIKVMLFKVGNEDDIVCEKPTFLSGEWMEYDKAIELLKYEDSKIALKKVFEYLKIN